jgi:hypothetical protein
MVKTFLISLYMIYIYIYMCVCVCVCVCVCMCVSQSKVDRVPVLVMGLVSESVRYRMTVTVLTPNRIQQPTSNIYSTKVKNEWSHTSAPPICLTSVGKGNFTFTFILTNQIFRDAVSNGKNYKRFWRTCLALHRPWRLRKQALPKRRCNFLETGTFNDIAVRTSNLALDIFSAHLVGSVLHVVDIQYQNEQPSTQTGLPL